MKNELRIDKERIEKAKAITKVIENNLDVSKTCKWEHIVDSYNDYYETECGESYCIDNTYGLKENKIKYCPYCGGEIKVVE